MQHHGINPNKHYLNYPEEEDEDNDTSSSDEEEQDSNTNQNESDLNNSFEEDNISFGSLSEVVNRVSETCLEGNVNIQRRQERIDELQEEFRKHRTDAENASIAKRRKKVGLLHLVCII